MEKRYKLTLSYDGTSYQGWQVQPNGVTIQQKLQQALEILLRQKTHLTGSGRTDAGVHAFAQVAHFDTCASINSRSFLHSLNGILPLDIRVKKLEQVSKDFHARFSAKKKIYQYHLHLDPVLDPFTYPYRHQVLHLNCDLMKKGATFFIGTHDFTSFANESHKGSAANNPIKTLYRIDFVKQPGGVYLEFEADGFLYKMVRNMTGTLIKIGLSKILPEEISTILKAKDRKKAPFAAPAKGLFLKNAIYP